MQALAMEIIERDFPDRWLLVEVTESKDGTPIKGVVLKASSRREEIVKEISRYKEKRLFFFFNGIAAAPETAFAL
jgi:hypothetical protein